jgi:hypothetical protein
MVSGITAGVGYWLFSYPIDVVKTKIHGDDVSNPLYKR